MKFTSLTAFSTLLLISTASAGNFFQQNARFIGTATQGQKVPGENPLYFCDNDTAGDVATIEWVNLTPNPPTPGGTLEIEAAGVLHDVIASGAKVDLTVKYGLITLIRESFDMCENAGQVDLECPVSDGKRILKKSVDIPKQVPPGKYTVVANAYTVDDRRITCITATVVFSSFGAEL
ncbi:phosphatidylglycerol/phosphatidylinositol transfer protein precursor [Trichophaea hybrida]|nr:phosphatidylglycerol/phosphatidylinositol transfer protein precursor [Trichophaea hybrida]